MNAEKDKSPAEIATELGFMARVMSSGDADADMVAAMKWRIDEMLCRPCLTLMDALAFAAYSHRMNQAADRLLEDGEPEAAREVLAYAQGFLAPAIHFLETSTRVAAESFMANTETVN